MTPKETNIHEKVCERYSFGFLDTREIFAPLTGEALEKFRKEREIINRIIRRDELIDNIKKYSQIAGLVILYSVLIFISSGSRVGFRATTFMPIFIPMNFGR